MHDDIDAVEAIAYGVGHGRAAFGRGNVGRHERIGSCSFFRLRRRRSTLAPASRMRTTAWPIALIAAGDGCRLRQVQIATH
jgi:hypothetical protein